MKKTIPSLNLVKLLIFDFDGTLMRSDRANWHAANFCLTKLNHPKVTLKKIKSHLGETASKYYPNLIKGSNKTDWPKLQTCVEANILDFFSQYLKLYPRVKQTLTNLKKRGYKLVLYSNAPKAYFKAALKATGLKPYFHLTQELVPGASKTTTIKKIINNLNLPAAVIGDRLHDIQAAKNNQLISISCQYGFGTNLQQSHYQISKFSQLLTIFRPKAN
jgi:HAD superfamily hydrolase (TIGR01549 family)